jgi:hypothetical protein
MGGAAAGQRAFPTPGMPGAGLGTNAVAQTQNPAVLPNLSPMPILSKAQPLKPLSPMSGRVIQPGQAAIPVGQSPHNPWGANRGGSGLMPLYRRPRTMPEYA